MKEQNQTRAGITIRTIARATIIFLALGGAAPPSFADTYSRGVLSHIGYWGVGASCLIIPVFWFVVAEIDSDGNARSTRRRNSKSRRD